MKNQKKDIMLGVLLLVILIVPGCICNKIPYNDLNKPDSENSLICITTFYSDDREKEFIIDTQEEYQSLLDYLSPSLSCEDFELPELDFSQQTLLGKFTSGVGCSVDFIRDICEDSLNKGVIYSINVIEEGDCEMLITSMNWILIPKVPSDYDIEFIVSGQNGTR